MSRPDPIKSEHRGWQITTTLIYRRQIADGWTTFNRELEPRSGPLAARARASPVLLHPVDLLLDGIVDPVLEVFAASLCSCRSFLLPPTGHSHLDRHDLFRGAIEGQTLRHALSVSPLKACFKHAFALDSTLPVKYASSMLSLLALARPPYFRGHNTGGVDVMMTMELKPAAGPFESLAEMRESPAWQYRAQELLANARVQGQAWAEREYACFDDPRDTLKRPNWDGITPDIPAEMVYSSEAAEGGPDRTLITDEVVDELREECIEAARERWECLMEHVRRADHDELAVTEAWLENWGTRSSAPAARRFRDVDTDDIRDVISDLEAAGIKDYVVAQELEWARSALEAAQAGKRILLATDEDGAWFLQVSEYEHAAGEAPGRQVPASRKRT